MLRPSGELVGLVTDGEAKSILPASEDKHNFMRLWNNPTVRSIIYQSLAVALVVIVGWVAITNALENIAQRGMVTGFRFLGNEAGFVISESLSLPENPAWIGLAFAALVLAL